MDPAYKKVKFKPVIESKKFAVYGYDVNPYKTRNRLDEIPRPINYLHIAIPYTSNFTNIVIEYIKKFSPEIVFIQLLPQEQREKYSMLPTNLLPIHLYVANTQNMKRHLLFWSKWIVTIPQSIVEEAATHLREMGFKVKVYRGSPETLELAKLWETVYRAVMMAAWQELHRITRRYQADLAIIAEFVGEVHEVLGDRPIYFPGYIGGHCLIPNTKILNKVHPSKLFDFMLESNEKRLKELKILRLEKRL